jgi:adenylate cyclase
MIQKRRPLSAIMFADIMGYSPFIHKNGGKGAILHQRHRAVSQVEHENYHGEIIQYLGDGTICIFNNAVRAVKYAIKMQLVFQEKEPIPLRIGLQVP